MAGPRGFGGVSLELPQGGRDFDVHTPLPERAGQIWAEHKLQQEDDGLLIGLGDQFPRADFPGVEDHCQAR